MEGENCFWRACDFADRLHLASSYICKANVAAGGCGGDSNGLRSGLWPLGHVPQGASSRHSL